MSDCTCPMLRGGGIDHQPNCLWMLGKRPVEFSPGLHKDVPIEYLKPGVEFRAKDDYKTLVEDIKQNGLITPIAIWSDGTIMNGHRRFKACLDLGIKKVNVRVYPKPW